MTLTMMCNSNPMVLVMLNCQAITAQPGLEWFFCQEDAIARSLYGAALTCGPVRLARCFGYKYPEHDFPLSDKGLMYSPEYDGSVDRRRYATTFTAIREVMGGLRTTFDNTNEHDVYHFQPVGNVVPSGVQAYYTVDPRIRDLLPNFLGTSIKGVGYSYNGPYRIWGQAGIGAGPSFGADEVHAWSDAYRTVIVCDDKLFGVYPKGSDVQVTEPSFTGGTRTVAYRNIQWTVGEDGISMSYYLVLTDSNGYDNRYNGGKIYPIQPPLVCRVRFSARIAFPYSDGSRQPPLSPEYLYFWEGVKVTEKFTYDVLESNDMFSDGVYYGGYPIVAGQSMEFGHGPNYCLPASAIYTTIDSSSSSGYARSVFFSEERRRIEGNFRAWVYDAMPDLRAASALSVGGAMQDLQSSSRTDVLQTIMKIPEVAAQIPNIKGAIQVFRKLMKKEIPISEIVSLLTQLRLQQSFQWRPEFDLLVKYLPQIPTILLSLPPGNVSLIGRGRYDYTFTEAECYRSVKMTCRSKIVATNEVSSPVATYLKLDSLGVLPTPANLWDLMPFSFVVNWFTNEGARIRALGNLANFWLLQPIVLVHTYKLTSDFTDVELSRCGLKRASPLEPQPSMTIYIREVSAYVSLPYSTRFDFERPTRAPDWSIVASLLWQWLS